MTSKRARKKTSPSRSAELDTDDRERANADPGILSPAVLPHGGAVMLESDPRLDEPRETEEALERATEPSETVESEEADERRKSDKVENSSA